MHSPAAKSANRSPVLLKQFRQIGALNQDLIASNKAIEDIATQRNAQNPADQQIEEVQHELRRLAAQIFNEHKKQTVLGELVELLRGRVKNMQARELGKIEVEDLQFRKAIWKLQKDIDIIWGKTNQQVAKIKELKQATNEWRSQRFMYSTLFKKLETDLKLHDREYTLNLIHNMNFLQEYEQYKASQGKLRSQDVMLSENAQPVRARGSELTASVQLSHRPSQLSASSASNNQMLYFSQNASPHVYFEAPRQDKSQHNTPKKALSRNKSAKQQKMDEIEALGEALANIKARFGCADAGELLDNFSTIQHENHYIQAQIGQMDQQIHLLRQNTGKLHREHAIWAVVEAQSAHSIGRDKQPAGLNNNESQGSQFCRVSCPQADINSPLGFELYAEVLQFIQGLGVPCRFQSQASKEEILQLNCALLLKIADELIPLKHLTPAPEPTAEGQCNRLSASSPISFHRVAKPRKQRKKPSKRQSSRLRELDMVYLRMDRFRSSERVLDRQTFCAEYTREMRKRGKSRRNN